MRATRIGAAAALALAVVTMGLAVVAANHVDVEDIDSKQECEAAGGTWENDQGTKTCTITHQHGESDVTTTDTKSQKGSFKSSHDSDTETCVNNPSGSHCPPGQQS